jgi:hypothetical protein
MKFETEYELQEFRGIQHEHFDGTGKIYAGNGKEHRLAEQMLQLINLLEQELGCQCTACVSVRQGHDSDCAVHNMPAYPNQECNCSIRR